MDIKSDCLEVKGLEIHCIIGDLPEERVAEQLLVVDVRLDCDLRQAADSDLLRDTVDYAELVQHIRQRLRAARCHLIERAAQIVADVCLVDRRVRGVRVRVEKPGVITGLAAAAVEIRRCR